MVALHSLESRQKIVDAANALCPALLFSRSRPGSSRSWPFCVGKRSGLEVERVLYSGAQLEPRATLARGVDNCGSVVDAAAWATPGIEGRLVTRSGHLSVPGFILADPAQQHRQVLV